MCSAKGHVCFTPESGHVQCIHLCLLWAHSRHHYYSITASARPISVLGTERPSAFAVLRLMHSSPLVACCTGKLAGFSPFKTRPVQIPACRWLSLMFPP